MRRVALGIDLPESIVSLLRVGSLALCLLLQALPAVATEKATKATFEFSGAKRTYYYFVPDDPGPLSLVLLLHGSGRNGEVMVDAWKDLAAKEHFIIAAPDAYDSAGWSPKMDSPSFLHAVVKQVEATHVVDEFRIYLFGHSAGAEYALLMALFDSHYFAAVALHAGALRPENYKLFTYAGRRMPVAIWVGDRDQFFPLDLVKSTKKMFESNGFPIELTVIPNHNHDYYSISDSINAKAWDFLKKNALNLPRSTSQP